MSLLLGRAQNSSKIQCQSYMRKEKTEEKLVGEEEMMEVSVCVALGIDNSL